MQAFWAAGKKQDANSTWNMLSAASQKAMNSESAWAAALKQQQPSDFTVEKATINGNKATVKVTYTVGGQTSSESMPLIKENGVWKVDMSTQ
jgi:hypothetical protein